MKNAQAAVAEAIGTFALIFIGAGAILADVGLLGIALAHGLVLMCMIYATGHISGAHINPAVTISMWITKKIESAKAITYIIAQLVGASLAGFLLKIIFAGKGNLGTPGLGDGVTLGMGILVEAVLTFFLVFTIFGVAVDKRAPQGIYGLAIGLVLTFDILVGGALTGASMNPARTFGPAIASGFWLNHIVYWIGPIVGGVIAALVYDNVLLQKAKRKK